MKRNFNCCSNPGMHTFALLGSWIGLGNLLLLSNQLSATLRQMAVWSPAFSRTSKRLLVCNLSFNCLFVIFIFFSGRCDNFGYGFMTLSQNVFYQSDRATGWRYAAKQVRMPSVLGLAGLIFLASVVFNAPCILYFCCNCDFSHFFSLYYKYSHGNYAKGTDSMLKMANIDVSFFKSTWLPVRVL